MAEKREIEFLVLRYVPDAIKGEAVNIGIVMMEPAAGGLVDVRITRDWRRVKCLDPGADIEMLAALEGHLRTALAGTDGERSLKKLEESLANVVQMSGRKACLTENPAEEMKTLAKLYLETARPTGRQEASGRQRILRAMRDAFEQAGVWGLLQKEIAAEPYTWPGDPLKIDCGYKPNGILKMFHAVPVAASVEAAKALAFSYPQMTEGALKKNVRLSLTAVVDDEIDRGRLEVAFALGAMARCGIAVAATAQMAEIAEGARIELRA